MTSSDVRRLLTAVASGLIPADEASLRVLDALRAAPYDDLGFARVDHHRHLRQGFPEVVLGMGKTPAQVAAIAERIAGRGHTLLVTRTDADAYNAVRAALPKAEYHPEARAITLPQGEIEPGKGTVLVTCAGTSDVPVAEEAVVSAALMGNAIDRLYDVGVAGIHRVLREEDRLQRARVVIVVAGMEGALPSVIGGLVQSPVVAVPTSVGYGASFGGIAALLGMLNSCASGVTVVNIDNGFGAACMASRINHL